MFDHFGKITGPVNILMEITSQKKIESALLESEERFRLAVDAASMGIFDWDMIRNEFISSPRLNQIFGFGNRQTVSHRELINAIHPEDRPLREKSFLELNNRNVFSYEARVIWPDKSIHWIRVYGKRIQSEKHSAIRMHGIVMDTTDEKIIQLQLEESESRFRSIANFAPVLIWMSSKDKSYEFVNKEWLHFTGKEIEKELEFGWLEGVHPEDLENCLHTYYSAFDARKEFYREYRLRRSDGEYRWLADKGTPRFSPNEAFVGYIGTSVDIHDRIMMKTELEKLVKKRSDELFNNNMQLMENEVRYRKMIDEIQDYAILLINRDGIIQNWNKGAEKIKGYKTEEIVGKHFRIFYEKEDQEKKLPELMLANATKFGRAVHEGWRVRKNGSRFWGSVTVTALHDDDQNIIGFTKITRDLTDIKIANDELKDFTRKLELKNIELERMNNELEQFAYVASHDLQEPLRKIRTYSGILSENLHTQSNDASVQILNKILSAGERMSNLIYDLLNFSRLIYPSNVFEMTDLNKVIYKVIEDFELTVEQKQARIYLDTLPSINAIPLQMNQLFYNLLNNSLKFSRLNVSPVITIKGTELTHDDISKIKTLQAGRRYIDITITDNGIGFDQQYSKQIFEVFRRLENNNIYPGSGIGLALCRKIILSHEGEIYAESKENEGATFHVILPME